MEHNTGSGYINPPQALEEKIIHALYTRIEKRRRIRQWSFASMMGISIMIFVYTTIKIVTEFSSSSFYYYTSLVRTDSSLLLSLWKEFALSLAESFPVVEAGLFCITLCLFLVAIRGILTEQRHATLQTI